MTFSLKLAQPFPLQGNLGSCLRDFVSLNGTTSLKNKVAVIIYRPSSYTYHHSRATAGTTTKKEKIFNYHNIISTVSRNAAYCCLLPSVEASFVGQNFNLNVYNDNTHQKRWYSTSPDRFSGTWGAKKRRLNPKLYGPAVLTEEYNKRIMTTPEQEQILEPLRVSVKEQVSKQMNNKFNFHYLFEE